MDGFAITDHNSFKVFKKEELKFQDILIIKGMEIHTEHGDLIGLFLNKGIESARFEEAIKEIKKQGGISVLPHPYRGHTDVEAIAQDVDVIEAFNGLTDHKSNRKAAELAKRLNKPVIACSDAHVLGYIGACYTEIDKPIRENLLAGKMKIIEGRPGIGAKIANTVRQIKNMFRGRKIRQL
jgi:predicted metal-dependent phosphoesterase TrpH